jgi:hypothetical protein
LNRDRFIRWSAALLVLVVEWAKIVGFWIVGCDRAWGDVIRDRSEIELLALT